jgi:hypothetical protein
LEALPGLAGGAASRHGAPNTEVNPAVWPFCWPETEASDPQIHGLAGELYGLTAEEIAIVDHRGQ